MDIIEDFRKHLLQLGYNKSSIYMLHHNVHEFLEFLKDTLQYQDKGLHGIDCNHINSFYNWLHIRPNKRKEGGLSEVMITHFIYSLRVFFNYLEMTGEITFNPISVMKFRRPKTNRREPLTQYEIKELFQAAGTLKEKAILHLFYSLGLRRSEAEALKTNDVHLKSGILYVREGKGHKRRAIPMTEKVRTDLESYYTQERKLINNIHDKEAFIINKCGYKMSGNSYNNHLKKILQRTDINKPEISLHYLRHSIATHLLENGLSVEYVRDFLGHSYLETTQIYAKVSKKQLKEL